jgi:transporter family protein
VILAVLAVLVYATGKWQSPAALPARSVAFLVLSALATGASWVCYFRALELGDAARVAPLDKLSVVLVRSSPWHSWGSDPRLATGWVSDPA